MAGIPAGLPAGVRVSDHISLGVIAKTFPPDRVQQVLAETGKASERERDLPAQVMVYYAIAMALYMGSSTREVLRCLLEGLRWLWGADAVKVAGKSGISQARSRLGEVPLRRLYEQVVQPVATRASKGAWYRGWRLVSLDGSSLDVADTAENGTAFGYPGASRGESAFPQLRFVALVENGTHVLFGAKLGRYADSETTLARDVTSPAAPVGAGRRCAGAVCILLLGGFVILADFVDDLLQPVDHAWQVVALCCKHAGGEAVRCNLAQAVEFDPDPAGIGGGDLVGRQ